MTTVGGYEIPAGPIARDAQGEIYAGASPSAARAFLKTLPQTPRSLLLPDGATVSPDLLLADRAIKQSQTYYAIIDAPEGELLLSALKALQQGIWGRFQMLNVCVAVCRAVESLHACGKYHGAIHPGSVLIRKDTSAALLCFEPMDHDSAAPRIGENEFAAYLSQEQLRGLGGPASDIYALGVLLFELYASALPFAGADAYDAAEQIMWGSFKAFSASAEGLDEQRLKAVEAELAIIGMIASKAVQRDPALRYASVSDLRVNLEQIRDRLSPTALGRRLFEQGRYQQAAGIFHEAVLHEDAVTGYLYLGNIYGSYLNNFEKGVLAFKRALKAEPTLDSARLGLADLYSRNGHHELAKKTFVELLNERPDDLRLLLGYAQALAMSGNRAGCLNILLKALEKNPYSLPVYVKAIGAAEEEKDLNKAESICNQAIGNILKVLDKGNLDRHEIAQVYYARGELHHIQGRAAYAIKWLRHAIEQDPAHAPSHLMLAQLYAEQGQMDLALKHFSTCLMLNPGQQGLLTDLEKIFGVEPPSGQAV